MDKCTYSPRYCKKVREVWLKFALLPCMQSPFCGQSGLFIVWLSSGMPPSSSGGDYLCKKLEEIEIVEAKDESGRQSSGTITLMPSFSLCLLLCFCTFTSFVLCCSFFFSLLYELHSSTNRPCSLQSVCFPFANLTCPRDLSLPLLWHWRKNPC